MSSLERVAYVCTDPGVPVFGTKGSSVHVCALLGELVQRGCEVHLFTPRPGGTVPERLVDVEVHELPRVAGRGAGRERGLVRSDAELLAMLDRVGGRTARGFDLVYQRHALWSCEGLEVAVRRGWPSVLEINAPLVEEQQRHREIVDRHIAEARTHRAVRAATGVYAVSSAVAQSMSRYGREVAVVPNGVDVTRHRGLLRARAQGDPIVIGFVGTFKPWHDLDAVIDALAALRADPTVPPVRLLLLGDGPERSRLLARADRQGLGPLISSPGTVRPDEVPRWLAQMDLAVAPYGPEETYFSPIKVFEYLAAGLPTVVSAVGGLDELLDPEREAIIVAPGDQAAFVSAVRRLCVDADLRRRLGRAGRAAVVDRFGWHHTVDRALGLVSEPAIA